MTRLGLALEGAGRWWSRDGQLALDMMARPADGRSYLFGECKWSQNQPIGIGVYASLVAKVQRLPEARYRRDPRYILFSIGSFSAELSALEADPTSKLTLVGSADLLPAVPSAPTP